MNPSMFPCWAVVSQMGHRTVAGHVTVDTSLGTPLLVVDVPGAEASDSTNHWGEAVSYAASEPRREIVAPASLYGISVSTEERVREIVTKNRTILAVAEVKRMPLAYEIVDESPAETPPETPAETCPDGRLCAANGCTPDKCNVPY